MSYQKQIHDYLNGDLTSEEEKRLFDELSDNPALREELAMQMKLQQTVQKDMASNSISPIATAAIFSALNFAIPVKNPLPASKRRFRYITKSFSSTLISGLAFATAIICLMYVLSHPSSPQFTETMKKSGDGPLVEKRENQKAGQPNPPIDLPRNDAQTQDEIQILKIPQHSASVASSEAEYRRMIPNEPMKVYFDIGKFSSVDYLTPTKIIGVADRGMIYYSDNAGKSWVIQTSGTSSDLSGIHFIDTTQGIIVGSQGTVLETDNAGREWHPKQSGIDANLIAIRYATHDTVYACGAQGTIIRSITGGTSWEKLESGTRLSLFKLFFENGSTGFVTGEHGIRLETHNAGASWDAKK